MATLALLHKSYVKGTEDLQNFSIVLCIFFLFIYATSTSMIFFGAIGLFLPWKENLAVLCNVTNLRKTYFFKNRCLQKYLKFPRIMGTATGLKFSNACLLDPDPMKSYLSLSHICLCIFIGTNFSNWLDFFRILERRRFFKEIWELKK